jgi:hypothetical protein
MKKILITFGLLFFVTLAFSQGWPRLYWVQVEQSDSTGSFAISNSNNDGVWNNVVRLLNGPFVVIDEDTIATRDFVRALSVVDSTRLEQDSILVYYQAGAEVGRDTIAGTGGGGGGAIIAGSRYTVTEASHTKTVGQMVAPSPSGWFVSSANPTGDSIPLSMVVDVTANTFDIVVDTVTLSSFSGVTIGDYIFLNEDGALSTSSDSLNIPVARKMTASNHFAIIDWRPLLTGSGGGGSGDNWGSQVVESDATLTGTGVTGSELKVDTSIIASSSALQDTASNIRSDFPDISNLVTQTTLNDSTAAIRADFPAGDNWGTQVVESDATLTGGGISGDALKVDTSLIATIYDIDSTRLIQDSILVYYQAGAEIGRDTITGTGTGGGGGGDNWGSQVVESDATLTGTGVIGNELKVDTSEIATQYDISQTFRYTQFTDQLGFFTAIADQAEDVLTFRSPDNSINFTAYNDDATWGDNLAFEVASVDWDALAADARDSIQRVRGIERAELADSTAAIRADFPTGDGNGIISALPLGDVSITSIPTGNFMYWDWATSGTYYSFDDSDFEIDAPVGKEFDMQFSFPNSLSNFYLQTGDMVIDNWGDRMQFMSANSDLIMRIDTANGFRFKTSINDRFLFEGLDTLLYMDDGEIALPSLSHLDSDSVISINSANRLGKVSVLDFKDGNGLFDSDNDGGTVPTSFDLTPTDSITINATNAGDGFPALRFLRDNGGFSDQYDFIKFDLSPTNTPTLLTNADLFTLYYENSQIFRWRYIEGSGENAVGLQSFGNTDFSLTSESDLFLSAPIINLTASDSLLISSDLPVLPIDTMLVISPTGKVGKMAIADGGGGLTAGQVATQIADSLALGGTHQITDDTLTINFQNKKNIVIDWDLNSVASLTVTSVTNAVNGHSYIIHLFEPSSTQITWPSGTGGVYLEDNTAAGTQTYTVGQIVPIYYNEARDRYYIPAAR